jgi:hypothetical protein
MIVVSIDLPIDPSFPTQRFTSRPIMYKSPAIVLVIIVLATRDFISSRTASHAAERNLLDPPVKVRCIT